MTHPCCVLIRVWQFFFVHGDYSSAKLFRRETYLKGESWFLIYWISWHYLIILNESSVEQYNTCNTC